MKLFLESLHHLIPIGVFFIFCVIFLVSCVYATKEKHLEFNGEDITLNGKKITP